MTIKHTLLIIITLAVLSATPDKSYAVEALSTEELISHCKEYADEPEGVDGIFCVRYIQGFIDGAIATDERVVLNVAKEYEKDETFTQRATRTRLGKRLKSISPTYYAEFCIGEPLLVDVAKTIIKDLINMSDLKGREMARDVVYTTLRREYPCEPRDK